MNRRQVCLFDEAFGNLSWNNCVVLNSCDRPTLLFPAFNVRIIVLNYDGLDATNSFLRHYFVCSQIFKAKEKFL